MKNSINIWLERLSSLYRSQLRQTAANEGLQSVHLEILQYLSICNDYSNTAQALSEYLGQTKGSISQSLKIMEKMKYIERVPSAQDKRVFKLYLSASGKNCLERLSKDMVNISSDSSDDKKVIMTLLKSWQSTNNKQGFGQCITCQFNEKSPNNRFKCGLTGDSLKKSDTTKICREHEFDIK